MARKKWKDSIATVLEQKRWKAGKEDEGTSRREEGTGIRCLKEAEVAKEKPKESTRNNKAVNNRRRFFIVDKN